MSLSPAEFLKLCEVFGVPVGGSPSPGAYLPLAGGTLTGTLILDPGANLVVNDLTQLPQAYFYDLVPVSFGITHTTTNVLYVMPTAGTVCSDALGVATYTNGVVFGIKNISAGTVSFVPKLGDTIDGATSLTIPSQGGVLIVATASQWSTIAQTNFAAGGAATPAQVQSEAFNAGLDTGAADAYVVTLSPVPAALTNGMTVSFTPTNTNLTTTPTLQVNAFAAKGMTYCGKPLLPGDILLNNLTVAVYSAALDSFEVLTPAISSVVPFDITFNQFSSAVDSGIVNAYVANLSPDPSAIGYADNMPLTFTPQNTNTITNPTVQVGSLAPVVIVKAGGAPLALGDMVAGTSAYMIYSSANGTMQLLNPQTAASSVSPLTTKGDLYGFSTTDARIPVGGNGTLLQANSAQALGLQYTPYTLPLTAGGAGVILRSDGTNYLNSTATFADTYAANSILYASATDTVSALLTANDGVLTTSAAGVPSISSTLPAPVQLNITQLGVQAQALNMGGFQINGLATPVASTDAVNKAYADSIASGLNPVPGVYSASTADLAGYTYNNGAAGVGATLTAPGNGVFTDDGVSPPIGSRWLYKNDTAGGGAYNGIYTVTVSSAGAPAVLTRATDFDTVAEMKVGTLVFVTNGTANMNSSWYLNSNVVTIGTSPVDFAPFFSPASYLSSTLLAGYIYVGNASNVGTGVAMSGDAALSNAGALTISTNVVSNTKLAQMPTMTIKGNSTGGTANAADLTVANLLTMIGVIPLINGGTNADLSAAASNGGIVWSNATQMQILAGVAATGRMLQSGNVSAPTWSTAAYPATAGTSGNVITSNGTDFVSSAPAFVKMPTTVVTATSQAAAVNNAYVSNNAGVVTVTLPSTAAVGDVIEVSGLGAGGWVLAQNASQTMNFNSVSTTAGVGGSLASTARYNSVTVRCVVANTTFNVIAANGNLTVV